MTPEEFLVLRQRGRWTPQEVAALLGVHWTTIYRYERGARQIPEPVAHLLTRLVKDHRRQPRKGRRQ